MYLERRKAGMFLVLCLILYGSVFLCGCTFKSPAPDHVTSTITSVSTPGNNHSMETTNLTTSLYLNQSTTPEDTPVPPIATTPLRI